MPLSEFYIWIKALHVVAAITFVSGVLMTAVLLSAIPGEGEATATAITRRVRRWDKRVTTPAMVATWALGLTLGLTGQWFASGLLRATERRTGFPGHRWLSWARLLSSRFWPSRKYNGRKGAREVREAEGHTEARRTEATALRLGIFAPVLPAVLEKSCICRPDLRHAGVRRPPRMSHRTFLSRRRRLASRPQPFASRRSEPRL